MTRPLIQLKMLSVTFLSILLVGLAAMTGAADAAQDALNLIVKQAENEVSESGDTAARARAGLFARDVCQRLVPKIRNAAEAENFVDHYDHVQRERDEMVSEVR